MKINRYFDPNSRRNVNKSDNSESTNSYKDKLRLKSDKELDYELVNKIKDPKLRSDLKKEVDHTYSKGRRLAQDALLGLTGTYYGGLVGRLIADKARDPRDPWYLNELPTIGGMVVGMTAGLGESADIKRLNEEGTRKYIKKYIDAEQEYLSKSGNSPKTKDTTDSFDSII